jgi:hypothetical protein
VPDIATHLDLVGVDLGGHLDEVELVVVVSNEEERDEGGAGCIE